MMSIPSKQKPKYKDVAEASHIYFLPNLLTAGNLFFGFLSIIRCIQANKQGLGDGLQAVEYYTQAVWCILFAGICDALDGRVARVGGRESLFGKEFDSIADVVSFGVAPSMMVFFLILSPTEGYAFFRQVGWLFSFIYLLCAAVRLARFNVLTNPCIPRTKTEVSSNDDFVGLPTPAAAGMIASLVLVLLTFDLRKLALLLPILMFLIAFLMVSNIAYPSFKNINWQTKTRSVTLIFIVIFVLTASLFFKRYIFAVFLLTYIFYGLVRHIRTKWRSKTRKEKGSSAEFMD